MDHDDPAAEFRLFLQNWMHTTGWTQYQIQAATGINQSLISRWLNPDPGRITRPKPDTLMKLAPVVGRTYDELMRMAGYQLAVLDGQKASDPPELAALIADLRAGWLVADSAVRQIGADVTRAAFHIRKARRGRTASANESDMHARLDQPNVPSDMHGFHASLAMARSI